MAGFGAGVGLRRPTKEATLVQPRHPNRFFANISPKPSMTPLIKGKSRLMASAETNARARPRFEREGSKMESVTEGGATAGNVNAD